MVSQPDSNIKILAKNKRAFFNYTVEESFEAGIELAGTEVKSIRAGKFSFADSYARIKNDELWLVGVHITPYDFGNIFNHDADRTRKLLIHKQELKRLKRKVDEKGYTLVPLKFYLKKSLVKVEIGICRGKKLFDKRESIKKKDLKRESDRELRGRF